MLHSSGRPAGVWAVRLRAMPPNPPMNAYAFGLLARTQIASNQVNLGYGGQTIPRLNEDVELDA